MQCTDRNKSDKQLFSEVMSSQRLQRIQNTLNISLDYVKRQTTQNTQYGIQWTLFSQLEDLDYADDIALLYPTANHMHQKAHILRENVRKTRFLINHKNTKVMCMNLREHPQIKIEEEELEVVTDKIAYRNA